MNKSLLIVILFVLSNLFISCGTEDKKPKPEVKVKTSFSDLKKTLDEYKKKEKEGF